ncbi:hypothetical protein [Motiliproteus sp.]|uniref:hypothetical protein n=1 Tax=Motiliproteus sp. TaxID=1898955 RepID=UPI003BA86E42
MNSAIALNITDDLIATEALYSCRIQSLAELHNTCIQVFLTVPSDFPRFHPGQYLELVLNDGQSRPFSIANFDPQFRCVELHIEINPNSATTTAILDHVRTRASIQVKTPQGDVRLRQPTDNVSVPHVFLAAGSGFAQIKALLQQQLHRYQQAVDNGSAMPPLYLLWGTETANQRYLKELVRNWLGRHQSLKYFPLIWQQGDSWEITLKPIINELKQAQFYLCGSPNRVYRTLDFLEQQGIDTAQVQSDVFSYAPRPLHRANRAKAASVS